MRDSESGQLTAADAVARYLKSRYSSIYVFSPDGTLLGYTLITDQLAVRGTQNPRTRARQ